MSSLNYFQTDYEIFNLGHNEPVELKQLIETLEEKLGKKALINHSPDQLGDVPITLANISKAQSLLNYSPKTSFSKGIENFVEWFIVNQK